MEAKVQIFLSIEALKRSIPYDEPFLIYKPSDPNYADSFNAWNRDYKLKNVSRVIVEQYCPQTGRYYNNIFTVEDGDADGKEQPVLRELALVPKYSVRKNLIALLYKPLELKEVSETQDLNGTDVMTTLQELASASEPTGTI